MGYQPRARALSVVMAIYIPIGSCSKAEMGSSTSSGRPENVAIYSTASSMVVKGLKLFAPRTTGPWKRHGCLLNSIARFNKKVRDQATIPDPRGTEEAVAGHSTESGSQSR